MNPVEVVALGAAVLAGRWPSLVQKNLVGETPFSIGLETLGGAMTKVIPRNTTFPPSKSEVFSTATGGQTSAKINVLQGKGEFVRDNKSVGCFRLDGIPPAPCGIPQIKVRFDIDAKGVLTVTAVDKGTGKKQDIIVTDATNSGRLSFDEARKRRETSAEKILEEKEAIDKNSQIPMGDVLKPLRGLLV